MSLEISKFEVPLEVEVMGVDGAGDPSAATVGDIPK